MYECTKRNHLDTASLCRNQGITFVPMVAEPTGAWGPIALKTFAALAKTSAAESGNTPKVSLSQLLEHLCVIIRRSGAQAVLRRTSRPSAPPGGARPMAQAILQSENSA